MLIKVNCKTQKGFKFSTAFSRSEIWFLSKGKCIVNYGESAADDAKEIE